MHCLFLDLASHEGLLACVSERRVLAQIGVDHRLGDHELVPLTEDLLKRSVWVWKDLTHVACVIGPGGFMSLRVAVAFTNTLADQLQIPSTGIRLSDLCAARVENKDFLWLHSTKKQELFVRGFGKHAKQWPDPLHILVDAFVSKVPEGVHWVGELIPEHRSAFAALKMTELPVRSTTEVLPEFLTKQKFERMLLQPWYGRGW